jgi:hypothetical protein
VRADVPSTQCDYDNGKDTWSAIGKDGLLLACPAGAAALLRRIGQNAVIGYLMRSLAYQPLKVV